MVAMSSTSRQARQFRILALPLARLPRPASLAPPPPSNPAQPTDSSSGSTRNAAAGSAKTPLMLFHVVQPDPSAESGPPTLTKRAMDKAADVWYQFGQKDPKSWSFWIYKRGERLMDRIEYEEWSLKAIQEGQGVKIVPEGKEGKQERIEVCHPRLVCYLR